MLPDDYQSECSLTSTAIMERQEKLKKFMQPNTTEVSDMSINYMKQRLNKIKQQIFFLADSSNVYKMSTNAN